MLDPRHCSHPAVDVVLVEDGQECTRCGLVVAPGQSFPPPGREYHLTVPVPERAKAHIDEIRADLARRRVEAKARGRAW